MFWCTILCCIDRFFRTSVRLMWISTWLAVKVGECLPSFQLHDVNAFYCDLRFLFSFCGGTIGVWRLLLWVDHKAMSFCLCSWCCALLSEPSWGHIAPQIRPFSGECGSYFILYLFCLFGTMLIGEYTVVSWVSCIVTVSTLHTETSITLDYQHWQIRSLILTINCLNLIEF